MSTTNCDCECLGCRHFHGEVETGRDAHHVRILLALDRSVAAVARSRGIPACDGLHDNEPCEVGELHTRTSELANALAALLEDSSLRHEDAALDAVERLAAALREANARNNPRLS